MVFETVFGPLEAVSEYSKQISLLQLCMCATARIKTTGRDKILCDPPDKPCMDTHTHATNMHVYSHYILYIMMSS